MALGTRSQNSQTDLFVPVADLPKTARLPFYTKLNQILADTGFDQWVEAQAAPHYKQGGRPGIPPGTYVRMVMIGYFEGLGSQREIAWRCADSLGLREFLGLALTDASPDHSSLTVIRQRLPETFFTEVFAWVLARLREAGLLKGRTLAIDATTLKANAALRRLEHKVTGEDYQEYVRRLMQAEGIANPTDEEVRRFDRHRKGRTTSNAEWKSATDQDARITKLKDGRTGLAYKAEHGVDLDSGAIVVAQVTHADRGDTATGPETLVLAQAQLERAGVVDETEPSTTEPASEAPAEAPVTATVTELVADKGYHGVAFLAQCAQWQIRTYIPEREDRHARRWQDKPAEWEAAFRGNRRRSRGSRGKALLRRRGEKLERSFAHVCETGGGRRMWLRGMEKANKQYQLRCAGFNLALLLREKFGLRKPRSSRDGGGGRFGRLLSSLWQGAVGLLASCVRQFLRIPSFCSAGYLGIWRLVGGPSGLPARQISQNGCFSTGC